VGAFVAVKAKVEKVAADPEQFKEISVSTHKGLNTSLTAFLGLSK